MVSGNSGVKNHRNREDLRMRCISIALCALVLFGVFYIGSQSFAADLFQPPDDKIVHFLVFGLLAGSVWGVTGGRYPVAIGLAVGMVGAIDELHQAYLPGRSMDGFDLLSYIVPAGVTFSFHEKLSNQGTRLPKSA